MHYPYSFGTDGAASSNTVNPCEQARMFALLGKPGYENLREELEELEHLQLDKKAAFSDESKGRLHPEEPRLMTLRTDKTPGPYYDVFPEGVQGVQLKAEGLRLDGGRTVAEQIGLPVIIQHADATDEFGDDADGEVNDCIIKTVLFH